MEGLQKAFRALYENPNLALPFSSSSSSASSSSFMEKGTKAFSTNPSDGVLVIRPARQSVSLLTCSKLCGFFFVGGVVVGYMLNGRVRRWAYKLLRRINND